MLNLLKHNKHLTIKPTDKNLGPAIMETKVYIKQVLTEHLLTKDYKQLTTAEAKKAELTYFKCNIHSFHRTPIFYGLPKVHKPLYYLEASSKWLQQSISSLLHMVRLQNESTVTTCPILHQNSKEVIKDLKAMHIPKRALLFSADAVAMYTTIDTNLGISSIRDLITEHQDKLPTNFPTNLIGTQTCVMKCNFFTFSDTNWLQLAGTAMGTPVACSDATVSFGQYENTTILTQFRPNLLYYKRYIDDMIGIWLPQEIMATSRNKQKQHMQQL